MHKVCAIVAAAGKGKRMGKGFNKLFIKIKDKPILYYTLKKLSDSSFIDEIVLSASQSEIEYCQNEIVKKYNFDKVKCIIPGGEERQESVFNALKAVKDCDIVLIHDGARPFIDEKIIKDGVFYADKYGASACGVRPKDTIKLIGSDGYSCGTLDRDKLFCIQTPQCFKYDIILNCHKAAKLQKKKFTDDTSLVENSGYNVFLYEGSYDNIKITTPVDITVAEGLLSK